MGLINLQRNKTPTYKRKKPISINTEYYDTDIVQDVNNPPFNLESVYSLPVDIGGGVQTYTINVNKPNRIVGFTLKSSTITNPNFYFALYLETISNSSIIFYRNCTTLPIALTFENDNTLKGLIFTKPLIMVIDKPAATTEWAFNVITEEEK